MLDDRFLGLWQRVSIALDGGPAGENQQVYWLQAGDGFADVRVPIDPDDPAPSAAPVSFAGVTTWDGTSLCWHRDLDLHRVTEADIGAVTWDDGDLIETGEFSFAGRLQPYVERWRRAGGALSPRLSLRRVDGLARLVRVGPHSLTVLDDRAEGPEPQGAYRAVYRSEVDGVSLERAALGPGASELPAPPATALAPGDTIELDGASWLVEESVSS